MPPPTTTTSAVSGTVAVTSAQDDTPAAASTVAAMSAFEVPGEEIGAQVSVIAVDAEPGEGPALHRHDDDEVFVVLEGEALITLGHEERRAGPGEVVLAPAGVPHRFVAVGPVRLRQVDIHCHPRFETDWLLAGRSAKKSAD